MNWGSVRHEYTFFDVSGGQVPASIVGAFASLNRPIKTQYVQTNPPKDVISFDLVTVPTEVIASG